MAKIRQNGKNKREKVVENEQDDNTVEATPHQDGAHEEVERPMLGYLTDKELTTGVIALKEYICKSKALKLSCAQRKNLLEAGEDDPSGLSRVLVDVVFKNVPSNSKTYIHNVTLPHHWRLEQEPEDLNVALFVRHRKPENEVEKIQFSKSRDLDIDNTHNYYLDLFENKLDESLRSRISRIITVKELATEFNTFQRLDRLAKTYDLFLSDKQLMENKLNPLPRRLGRRFWVREKRVPIMVKLNSPNLNERFQKALSTEPFYVLGRTATEQMQVGIISQPNDEIVANIKTFLKKLYSLYGDNIRFLRLRTNWGIALPLYADLSAECPQVTMQKTRVKVRPVVDDFDLLPNDARISVHPGGSVKVLKTKRKRTTRDSPSNSFVKRIRREVRNEH